MSHEIAQGPGGGGILANKVLWLCIGLGIFILVGIRLCEKDDRLGSGP
jgi:hypothetical protein